MKEYVDVEEMYRQRDAFIDHNNALHAASVVQMHQDARYLIVYYHPNGPSRVRFFVSEADLLQCIEEEQCQHNAVPDVQYWYAAEIIERGNRV